MLVPTHLDNSIELPALEAAPREALAAGKKIAAIVATMGSTDAFGIDDLRAIDACAAGWPRNSRSPTCRTCTPTP